MENGKSGIANLVENGILGFLNERLVLLNDLLKDDMQIELLKRTPACFLGSCRYKLKSADACAEEYEKIFAHFHRSRGFVLSYRNVALRVL